MADRKDSDELEQMIDRHGLASVLSMVADICYEKSEHIESNWQDRQLAKLWTKCGTKLHATATSALVKALP